MLQGVVAFNEGLCLLNLRKMCRAHVSPGLFALAECTADKPHLAKPIMPYRMGKKDYYDTKEDTHLFVL